MCICMCLCVCIDGKKTHKYWKVMVRVASEDSNIESASMGYFESMNACIRVRVCRSYACTCVRLKEPGM